MSERNLDFDKVIDLSLIHILMGGVVIDGGKFDWAKNDKFPGLSKPNPSYHGVVFTEACGNIAYIMKLRTTIMRDQGATISPFNSFLLLQGLETVSYTHLSDFAI